MTVWPSGGSGFRGEAFGFLGEAFWFLGEAFGFIGEAFGFLGEAFGFIGAAVLLRRKLRAERRLAIDCLAAQFGSCSGTAAAVRSIVGKRVVRQKFMQSVAPFLFHGVTACVHCTRRPGCIVENMRSGSLASTVLINNNTNKLATY